MIQIMKDEISHPALDQLSDNAWESVARSAQKVEMPAGTQVFGPGEVCEGLPLVIRGEVRVQMTGAAGNEIVLYRIQGGELCPLSLACLLARGSHQSEAIVDEDTEALVIPEPLTNRLLNEEPGFRRVVLESYGQRLLTLMLVIEEVAFRRLDTRLAERLLARQRDGRLAATHQDLAVELGTAREVVSRLLKEFERRGLVGLERGAITLTDPTGIEAIGTAEAEGRKAG
jgi:CRP/FNR family transcriptional regulator